jgi:hypothetical protein
MTWLPRLTRVMDGSDLQALSLGLPCVDAYLEFVRARARLNTGSPLRTTCWCSSPSFRRSRRT